MKNCYRIPLVGGPFDGVTFSLNDDPAESVTIETMLAFDADQLRLSQGLRPTGAGRSAVYHLTRTRLGWRFVFHLLTQDDPSIPD